MKAFVFALILAVVPVSAWANRGDQGEQGDPAVIDRGDVIDKLEHIDALLSQSLGRLKPKDKSVPALRRAREELSALESDLMDSPNPHEWRGQRERERGYRDDAPPPSADRRPPAPAPMPDPAVAQLTAVLDSQPTLQARLQTLQVAASANYFLVRQAQPLIMRFNPGPDRAEAIRILSPRLLDRENEYQLTPGVAQAPPPAPPGPYANLTVRSSFAARSNVKLQPGLYKGNFGVPGSVTVEGSGRDQTVIDGDLVISGPFNKVKNLTVLGKVVITGSQNTLVDVDYRGGVDDRGQINRY